MNLLLDTHMALWALIDDPMLPEEARRLILDGSSRVFYSIASMWEVAIKRALKPERIPLSGVEFLHYCEKASYEGVPIRDRHVVALESLPSIHGDPFDRILIAQAKAEGFTFLTHDQTLGAYGDSVKVV